MALGHPGKGRHHPLILLGIFHGETVEFLDRLVEFLEGHLELGVIVNRLDGQGLLRQLGCLLIGGQRFGIPTEALQ